MPSCNRRYVNVAVVLESRCRKTVRVHVCWQWHERGDEAALDECPPSLRDDDDDDDVDGRQEERARSTLSQSTKGFRVQEQAQSEGPLDANIHGRGLDVLCLTIIDWRTLVSQARARARLINDKF